MPSRGSILKAGCLCVTSIMYSNSIGAVLRMLKDLVRDLPIESLGKVNLVGKSYVETIG